MAAKKVSQIDIKNELMYKLIGGATSELSYGGYNEGFITHKLSQMEHTLIVCSKCTGIMRDACNVKGGMAMACKACVGQESCSQPVSAIREMVLKLACKCPLHHRGCEWEGEMADVSDHLDGCGQFIIQCPYFKYGCSRELERENLETHRTEAKDHHAEMMSLFMAGKVERLEEEREQQKKVLDKLESAVECLLKERKYFALNGIIWDITDRETIRKKFQEFIKLDSNPNLNCPQNPGAMQEAPPDGQPLWPQYSPHYGLQSQAQYRPQLRYPNPNQQNTLSLLLEPAEWEEVKLPECANVGRWNGHYFNGPRFAIEYICLLYPQLAFDNFYSVSLNLVPNKTDRPWSLQGIWDIVLVNEKDPQEHWIREVRDIKFSSTETFKLIDIPSEVLLDDDYWQHGVIRLKVLFRTQD